MATLCQRLAHPFRRPVHYYTIAEPSLTPEQLQRQREKEKQRILDRIENDLDDGRVRPRGSNSSDSLPVIIDRGPYRGCLYPKDQLYFNSVMLAADSEPRYAGPPGRELRQETHRTPTQRPNGSNDKGPSAQPVPSEWMAALRNARDLKEWEGRNSINLIPARVKPSSNTQPPPRSLSPPRGPITPGTQEWDRFMDFPLDNPYHIYHNDDRKQSDEDLAASNPPILSRPTAVTEPQAPLRSHNIHARSEAQLGCHVPPIPTSIPIKPLEISSIQARPTQSLTWKSALKSILFHEEVDPAMRASVMERAQCSSTIGAPEHQVMPLFAPADVGLVPNFSYPIAASAFYDRIDAAQTPRARSPQEKEQRYEELLPNGVLPEHRSHASSNETLYRDPSLLNWPLRGGQCRGHVALTNGVPPGYYPSSSSSSSSDTPPNPHPRSPFPPNLVPEQISALLRSLLTSPELTLHHQIVHQTTPVSTSSQSRLETHARLIKKLTAAVYGLQVCIAGLEDNLVPQLSTYLEHKDREIDDLDVEISRLGNEITELRRTVDFGTRVLSQCRSREWEIWHTLFDIQRKREERCNSLSHVFSRPRSGTVPHAEAANLSAPPSSAAQAVSSGRAARGVLKKKELDALLLMAKQNIEIIDEGMKEMAGTVQAYLTRNGDAEKKEEEQEG
ncbi:hypothetical protein COCC4DRAFT_70330 [Bipolaris maydis ATCC 48331]|uniref:Uncharacterized protein n=2 Tax=Cochliobolus heterostrophus TaxID=5016 RepID=M2V1Z2_COCH5|nr:uncharacterized protein COCC4DRAFT_70330 [Bipolaris maydis ATCC 48331]EMD93962.1 hypothetical protein COCHEDRAFT_1169392 [Bipolaris maydis C5]KAH7564203.1 hypothetical protein BM1_01250 [Bipolaris maydis]ENI07736.1 hypothetical protein COCC4DRAFT_70330 [Bipolaris maydis ATCC 48331]KAJ5026828.1 hypothetical protein J3E73DRAFT_232489 [Bipolaris maydis]KAJ5059432.1 hypothetical protein J3E74DRAFT_475121 [Bipolaris maydis]